MVTVPAVAVKVAKVELAGTVTEDGTLRAVLLDNRETVLPPEGAAWVKVTVHVAVAPATKVAGLHASKDGIGPPPPVPAPAALNAAICARYLSASLNVKVAATGPAVPCTASSVTKSMLFTKALRVKPVPAAMVPKSPESSITTPKIRSPFAVVLAAPLVTPSVALVPGA